MINKPFPDLNRNGIPDYQEPGFWRGTWRLFRWAVLTFASPRTLVHRGVVAADQARAAILEGDAGKDS